jgi:hypothetical protein
MKQEPTTTSGLVAAHKYLAEIGRSRYWLWRQVRDGRIRTANICGKVYLSREDIWHFEHRAMAGEFAEAPTSLELNRRKAREVGS